MTVRQAIHVAALFVLGVVFLLWSYWWAGVAELLFAGYFAVLYWRRSL